MLPNISPTSDPTDKQGTCFICDNILVLTGELKIISMGSPDVQEFLPEVCRWSGFARTLHSP